MAEREPLAWITRENGAYLIELGNNADTADSMPEGCYSAASSKAKAMSVAREMCEEFGQRGPWRWERTDYGGLVLCGYSAASSDEPREGGDE